MLHKMNAARDARIAPVNGLDQWDTPSNFMDLKESKEPMVNWGGAFGIDVRALERFLGFGRCFGVEIRRGARLLHGKNIIPFAVCFGVLIVKGAPTRSALWSGGLRLWPGKGFPPDALQASLNA